MPIFRRSYQASEAVARVGAILGVMLLVAATLITVGDIVLRQTARIALAGIVDVTQLLVMGAVFMTIPFAFFTASHIAVDLLVDRLPPRGIAVFKALGAAVAGAFMAACLVYGWQQAAQQHGYGDRSQTIGIPILFYWGPLLLGCGLSAVAAALLSLRHALHAARGVDVISH